MRNESPSEMLLGWIFVLSGFELSCFSFVVKVCKLIRKILKERLCILTRAVSRLNWCFITESVSGLTGAFRGAWGVTMP